MLRVMHNSADKNGTLLFRNQIFMILLYSPFCDFTVYRLLHVHTIYSLIRQL
jgi:hypothetical protein